MIDRRQRYGLEMPDRGWLFQADAVYTFLINVAISYYTYTSYLKDYYEYVRFAYKSISAAPCELFELIAWTNSANECAG